MAYTITQRSRITAADGAVLDQFGCSIGLNANTLIVGAQGVDGAGHPYCGAAYIYTRPAIAGVWSLQQKLQETFPAYFEEPLPVPGGYWPYNLPFRRSYKNPYYGCLVGLWQADTAAIAVRLPWDAAWEPLYESWASHYHPMDPFGAGPFGYCGGPWQVITYARAAGVWSQLAIGKLDPLDYYAYTAPANPWPDPSGVPTSIRAFPYSISSLAVGDGIVAAGCIQRSWNESVFSYYGVNSHHGSGAVTVFSGGSEVCCIDDPDKHPGEFVTPFPYYDNRFGSSVSICPLTGTTMVIGAIKALGGSGRGRVYVFTGSGGSWSLQQTISPATGSCSTFGTSVAVYGDYLVVGAPTLVRGEVHIYKRTGVVWAEQALLTDAAGARFGSTVGIDKNTVLVGDPMVGAGAYGQISAYYRAGTTWTLVGRKYSTPTGNSEYMTQQGVAALGDGVPTYMAAVQRYSAGANTGAVVEFTVAAPGPGPGYPSITNNSPLWSGVLPNVDLTFQLIDPDLRADLDPTKTRVWVNGAVIYENEVPVSGWFVSRANLADGYAYTLYKAQYEWGAGLNTVRAYGEDYEGNAADRTWTFTVTDRPWVEATYPAAKAPPYTFDVDPATIIQFNAVTSNSTIDNAQTVIMVNGAVVYTGGVAAPGWGVSSVPVGTPGRIGLRYTLTHSVPFVSLSTVTVAVTLKNNAGETIPFYPSPPWNPWSFVIMDATSPVINNKFPADGSSDQATDVSIYFDVTDVDLNVDPVQTDVLVDGVPVYAVEASIPGWTVVRSSLPTGYRYAVTGPGFAPGAEVSVAVHAEDLTYLFADAAWTFSVVWRAADVCSYGTVYGPFGRCVLTPVPTPIPGLGPIVIKIDTPTPRIAVVTFNRVMFNNADLVDRRAYLLTRGVKVLSVTRLNGIQVMLHLDRDLKSHKLYYLTVLANPGS